MSAKYCGRSKGGIDIFLLENENGVRVELITYGARISKIILPCANGDVDVVAGYDDADGFLQDDLYFNCIAGRVCNRIGEAQFEINGVKYHLFKNAGEHTLHGGQFGFDKKMWKGEIVDDSIKMSYLSVDGEEGYPGNLNVEVRYTLTDDNALEIDCTATSDKDTICSLTNHAYFNLNGDFESALDNELRIDADFITPYDDGCILRGEMLDVSNTPYDFRQAKPIGRDINCKTHLLELARGYDFNYVLNKGSQPVAWAHSNKTNISMSVYTDRPCIQLYTGNFLDGRKGKKTYGYQSAFCLETQAYPNACNVKEFESVLLKRGEEYKTHTAFKFEF